MFNDLGQVLSKNIVCGISYSHANNQYLGELRTNGDINVKQAHFSGVDIKTSGSSARHQVREGETLRSIATTYYGNGDLWYIIADVNGLPSDADVQLVSGQTIVIPEQVNNTNSFDTFTVYNVAEQIGDTTPNLAYVPAPPQAGCNMIATLIIVAIAVIATAGAGTALIGAAAGNTTAFVGASGGLTALGGATAAVAGSVASQFAGMALGVQDNFSWSQVAVAAVTGGIASGISNAAGVGGGVSIDDLNILTEAGTGVNAGKAVLGSFGRAVTGAASAVGAAATNSILGQPSGFSWANVAGSAVGASFGSPLPGETATGNFFANVGNSIVGAAASYATKKLVNSEGTWNNRDVLVDAFGNAIGNSIVAAGQSQPRFTGTLDTSKLEGVLGQQYGSDFNDAIGYRSQESIIAQTGAIDIDLATVKTEDITPFALTDAGLKFATDGLANIQGLNTDSAAKKASVVSAQNGVRSFSENSVNSRLSDVRRSPIPYQGISENQLKGFLGTDVLADNFVESAFNSAFGPNNNSADFSGLGDGSELSILSNLSNLNSLTSGVIGTGLFFTQAGNNSSNNNFFTEFSSRSSIPVDHLGTPIYSSLTTEVTPGAEFLLDSSQYSITPNDGKILGGIGDTLSLVGVGFSVFGAVNETFLNDKGYDGLDLFREFGKFGTDLAAASTSLSRFARFTPAGLIYTGVDLAVQLTPSYTVRYGQQAGQSKEGFTKLLYSASDIINDNQQMNPNFKLFDPGKL